MGIPNTKTLTVESHPLPRAARGADMQLDRAAEGRRLRHGYETAAEAAGQRGRRLKGSGFRKGPLQLDTAFGFWFGNSRAKQSEGGGEGAGLRLLVSLGLPARARFWRSPSEAVNAAPNSKSMRMPPSC